MRIFLTAAVATLWLAGAAAAQQTALRPDYSRASSYRESEAVELKQTMTLNGQDVNTSAVTSTVSKVAVTPYAADGWATVKTEVESLQATVDTPLGEVKFDSAKPDEGGDLGPLAQVVDQFKAALDTKMTYKVSKELKAGDVDGPPPGVSAKEIRQQVQASLDIWPQEPVQPGATWEREVRQALGQGQALVFTRRFKYEGPEMRSTVSSTRRLEKVTAQDVAVKLVIDAEGGLPASIDKSDLKVTSSKRVLLFDPQLGRDVESSGEVTIAGDIVLDIAGMKLDGKLNLVLNIKKKEL